LCSSNITKANSKWTKGEKVTVVNEIDGKIKKSIQQEVEHNYMMKKMTK
jgi:hypothetical protein